LNIIIDRLRDANPDIRSCALSCVENCFLDWNLLTEGNTPRLYMAMNDPVPSIRKYFLLIASRLYLVDALVVGLNDPILEIREQANAYLNERTLSLLTSEQMEMVKKYRSATTLS